MGWVNANRIACSHCRCTPRRSANVGSAPYRVSPTHGWRIADMWTRIWWVRPVSKSISSRLAARNASNVV